MRGNYHLLALFLFFIMHTAASQSLIHGSVRGDDSTGISFANVLLVQSMDSMMVQGSVTDENGNFSLAGIQQGVYSLEVSRVGYAKSYMKTIHVPSSGKLVLPPVIMREDENELNEVTVKASKPLYEMEMGKLIINVQSSITSAGLTAIDILERSPGVLVNRSNNSFSLGGKDGVIVLMNGKRSYMPIEALYQMLAGINAGEIEKIEIMTVPPANYDSEGNAGFVNIVMKKSNEVVGTNGAITSGLGYGTGPQGNFSINLNHQGKKINWFGNYALNYLKQVQDWENYRKSSNSLETISTANISDRKTEQPSQNYRLGFDYLISKNTVISGLMAGYSNQFQITASTRSFLDYSYSADSLIDMTMVEKNHWKHLMGNLNLQHTLSKGQIINLNLDFLRYVNANPSGYINEFFSGEGSFFKKEENRISKDTPLNIWVGKFDHSVMLGNSIKVESGIKGTFSDISNNVSFETIKNGSWVENPTYSSYGDLKENILAAYSSINMEVDSSTTVNIGIRYELTKTLIDTREGGRLVDREYGSFFPTLFVSRKFNSNKTLNFSYGRRITRPTFNQMAPFVVFLDPYTFFSGNVNILPTFTHNLKTDYTFQRFVFSLQYSHDKNVIMRFQPSIDSDTNTLIFMSGNIDRRDTWEATLTLPWVLNSWWEMQNNFTVNWQEIEAVLNGEIYKVEREGFFLNSTQTFKLPLNFTLELAGNYVSPIINGYFNWLSRGFVNVGIQKEFNYGGILRLSCNDIFETTRFRWKTFEESSFSINGKLVFDSRRFGITYTHPFGNQKVKGIRNRATGSQEEQNRVTD